MKFMLLQLTPGDWAGIIGVAATVIAAFLVIIFQLGGLFATIKIMQTSVAEIPDIKARIARIEPLVAEIPGIKADIQPMKVEMHTMKVKVDDLWDARKQ